MVMMMMMMMITVEVLLAYGANPCQDPGVQHRGSSSLPWMRRMAAYTRHT